MLQRKGAMWNNTPADDRQPGEKKTTKLKGKYQKDIAAACRAKGKPNALERGLDKAENSKKKKEEEDEDAEDEDKRKAGMKIVMISWS